MNEKVYHYIASMLFGTIAVVHFVRGIQGWEAEIAGATVPIWVSWVAVGIAGYLAVRGLHFIHTEVDNNRDF